MPFHILMKNGTLKHDDDSWGKLLLIMKHESSVEPEPSGI